MVEGSGARWEKGEEELLEGEDKLPAGSRGNIPLNMAALSHSRQVLISIPQQPPKTALPRQHGVGSISIQLPCASSVFFSVLLKTLGEQKTVGPKADSGHAEESEHSYCISQRFLTSTLLITWLYKDLYLY